MLIELPNGKGRGQWQRILIDEFSDNPRWTAIIRCPDCGDILPIVNHAISSDGWVTPSVGHPVRVELAKINRAYNATIHELARRSVK